MTRTERTYYLVFGLYSLSWSFIGPMYALYLLSRGLDVLQVNLVSATYLISVFVFEVPTGAVADLVGRKVSFLLSCAVRALAFGLYAYADTFVDFLAAEVVDALGSTLASGALDAWAVDGMRAEGDRRSPDRFFARAQVVARGFMIVSGLCGGYVAELDMRLTWGIAAGAFVLTGVVGAVGMREASRPRRVSPREMSSAFVATVYGGFGIVRRKPVLLTICLLTGVAAFGSVPMHMYWQPQLQNLSGQGAWFMAWVWVGFNLAVLAGSSLIPRLSVRFRREWFLAVAALVRGAMLLIVGLTANVKIAVGALLVQEAGFGVTDPVVQAWMNDHVDDELRATVLSVRSMSWTFGGALGLVAAGLVARTAGLGPAWLLMGAALLLVAPGFLLLGPLRSPRR
ncbi:MFS transporter [Candidatus Binatia bacterium]|nr:MFS transporter [Candidatus Binatia bacterium]